MLGANCARSCADVTTWLETPRRRRPSSIRCWNARGSSRSSSPALSSSTRGSSSPFTATSTPASTATSLATTSARGDSWGEIDSIRHISPQTSGAIYCKQHCCWDVETLLRSRFFFVMVFLPSWLQLCVSRVYERTHSLWSHLYAHQTDYLNPLYRPGHSQTQGPLWPSTAPHCFK